MEAKPIFKPQMQIVSFHKVDEPDDYMFEHEDSHCLFTVWADGQFNPEEFDGIDMVKVFELTRQIMWLKDELRKNTDAKLRTSNYQVSDIIKLIDEAFSDLLTFPKGKGN